VYKSCGYLTKAETTCIDVMMMVYKTLQCKCEPCSIDSLTAV